MRSTVRIAAATAAIFIGTGMAHASSDRAWASFNARVTRSCLAASGIRNALPSTIVGFDDRAGKVAMLVSDRSRGSSRAKLCLYDKKTRSVDLGDAEMWSAPPQPR